MSDDLPNELAEPLMRLWTMAEPLTVIMRPRDAWIAVAVIQYATRNPQLSLAQKTAAEMIARDIQTELARLDPIIGKYLELGWDPALDVPN